MPTDKPILVGYPSQRKKSVTVSFPDGRVTIKVWANGDTIVDVEANGKRYAGEEAHIVQVLGSWGSGLESVGPNVALREEYVGIRIKGKSREK